MDEGKDQDTFSATNLDSKVDLKSRCQILYSQKSEALGGEPNINDNLCLEDEPYSAPVEILSEFLSTLMARNYKSALYYCKLILLYEPDNEIVQDFYPIIKEKIHLDNYESDESCDNDESSSSTKSESSTEYFSSTSVGTENMSSSSILSSEEEESSLD